jgi:hypothetical protein
MIDFETKKGKTVRLYPDGNGWKVKFYPGGELPEELQGVFTSQGIATKAIEQYISIGLAPSRRA